MSSRNEGAREYVIGRRIEVSNRIQERESPSDNKFYDLIANRCRNYLF